MLKKRANYDAESLPRVKPLQINTWESRPTEAKYRSSGDHARSVTSVRALNSDLVARKKMKFRTTLMPRQPLQRFPTLDIDLV
jgi:hypothetical protein